MTRTFAWDYFSESVVVCNVRGFSAFVELVEEELGASTSARIREGSGRVIWAENVPGDQTDALRAKCEAELARRMEARG